MEHQFVRGHFEQTWIHVHIRIYDVKTALKFNQLQPEDQNSHVPDNIRTNSRRWSVRVNLYDWKNENFSWENCDCSSESSMTT